MLPYKSIVALDQDITPKDTDLEPLALNLCYEAYGDSVLQPIDFCQTSCCNHLFFYADFLYWQVRTEGLLYAFTGVNNATSTSTIFETGQNVKPDYDSGIRVGVDYVLPRWDTWDLELEYLYFYSRATDSSAAPGTIVGGSNVAGPFLFPLFMNFNFGPNAQSAEADYHFTTHLLDLKLGKTFSVGRLMLHPHADLKGAHMDHHLDVTYFRILGLPAFTGNSTVRKTIDYWGGGVGAGLDGSWNFWNCFHLLARPSVGILWSYTRFDSREHLSNGIFRSSIDDFAKGLVPVIDIFLGLSWNKVFCNGFYANLHAGWEAQYYFNLIEWDRFVCSTNSVATFRQSSSFALSGLTAGILIGF